MLWRFLCFLRKLLPEKHRSEKFEKNTYFSIKLIGEGVVVSASKSHHVSLFSNLNFNHMNIQKARSYIKNFIRLFLVAAAIKFLMDEYIFNQEFRLVRLLFWSVWMALIGTWLYHRQRKRSGATSTES
ncbi:MAG TPA: hypothetical protein VGD22_06260 [Sphingobacteriaceae bacterium]